jgi:glycosyltransferase involved in cell wall biosynthesis
LEDAYQKLDLVCFPSHFNAPGRPIFEAALFGIPSVATISSPTSDTFIHNKTGLLVNPGDVYGISKAILKFYRDRKFLLSAGRNAKSLANRYYNINKNSLKVFNLYNLLIRNSKKNAHTNF